jgi:hypothetical protein
VFAPIVGARKLARHFLHEPAGGTLVFRVDQQVHMITGQAIIQQGDGVDGQRFSHRLPVIVPISRKPQMKLLVMAAVRPVKDTALD